MEAVIMDLFNKSIPDLFISFSRPFFTTMIGFGFMCKLLPNRLNIYTLTAISFIYALWANLRSPALFGTDYHLWMNIFINALTFSILIFLFNGKFWRRFIVYWYYQIILVMCETLSFVPISLYYHYLGYRGEWSAIISFKESEIILRLFYIFIVILFFLFMGFLSLQIWRRLLLYKFQPFYVLFIALPIGQLYSLSNVVNPNMGDWFFGIAFFFIGDAELAYRILSLFGVSACLAASIVLFYYILSIEKRTAIEAELKETRRIMELEHSRYSEIERQSEEMAKISHDFNNQLSSIIRLVHTGEGNSAQEMINALSKKITETNEDS